MLLQSSLDLINKKSIISSIHHRGGNRGPRFCTKRVHILLELFFFVYFGIKDVVLEKKAVNSAAVLKKELKT